MRTHIVRYLVGGSGVFLFNIGTFHILAVSLNMWYLYASTISFLATLIASFLVQKYWTFQDRTTEQLPFQITSFSFLGIINLVFNTVLMSLMAGILNVPETTAQIVTTGLIVTWSFFAYRYLFSRSQRNNVAE